MNEPDFEKLDVSKPVARPEEHIVAANWKMNPADYDEAKRLFDGIKKRASYLRNITTIICPPTLYLQTLSNGYSGSKLKLGAQDISVKQETGSQTGEVSAGMFQTAGATYAIIGHSERRALIDTDTIVKQKLENALSAGLRPIICVGEHERDNDGEYLTFISRQITHALSNLSRQDMKQLIIAYEPLWAIGRSADEASSPRMVHQMALYIKKVLAEHFGRPVVSSIPLLYGGSVERSNAAELMDGTAINGFLVGHASRDIEHFRDILDAVNDIV